MPDLYLNIRTAVQLFDKFSKKQSESIWCDVIPIFILSYVQANNLRVLNPRSAIVLAQTCLELIAWVLLVEVECSEPDGNKFKKIPAYQKFQKLFARCNISDAIPSSARSLCGYIQRNMQSEQERNSASFVITYIRNSIVHPNVRERIALVDNDVLVDVWNLGMMHLELALLNICEYRGKYYNRSIKQVENVPWHP